VEAADRIDQVKQRYLDHDQLCHIQALASAAGAVLVTEGFVFDDLHNRAWRVFVPGDQTRQLLKQGLTVTTNGNK
jgi:hypothetical protein